MSDAKPATDEELVEVLRSRGDRWLHAYYYAFDPTGQDAIDLILAAVAKAGKGSHHTESWNDDDDSWYYGGVSAIALIERMAGLAAKRIGDLEAVLRRIRNAEEPWTMAHIDEVLGDA